MPKIVQENGRPGRRETAGKGSVWDRVKPVSIDSTRDRILVYGHSGTGKTRFACTYPKPLLLIGTEDGTRSVHKVKGVNFIRVKSSQEIRELIDGVRNSTADQEYQTVVLDTVTEMQDMILKEVMGVDELPVQKSFGMTSRQVYGDCTFITKEILRDLLKLGEFNVAHSVILGQERAFNTDEEQALGVEPYICVSVSPSVKDFLNPSVDYNVRTYIEQKEEVKKVKVGKEIKEVRKKVDKPDYRMRLKAHSVLKIKFRDSEEDDENVPDFISNPTYEKIRALIEGKGLREDRVTVDK